MSIFFWASNWHMLVWDLWPPVTLGEALIAAPINAAAVTLNHPEAWTAVKRWVWGDPE